MPTPLLPDVVGLTIAGLLAQSSITDIVGTRVFDRIPATPTYPLVAVTVISDDEYTDPALGTARVQIDCWGAGSGQTHSEQARRLARTVRSVARDLRGTYAGPASATGVISAASPAAFISAFDPDTGRARFIIDLFIETHA